VGEIETLLARLWGELLGIERIGRYDNFFELGGYSLLAMQLFSRVSQALTIDLPLSTLFAQPTLNGLAQSIIEALQCSKASTLPPIITTSRDQQLVLSFAQQRLWFLTQLDPLSASYHMPLAWRLHGPLDVAAWRRSLDTLFARHEALRSIFVSVEGEAHLELLSPDNGLPLIEQDLRALPDPERGAQQLAAEECRAPFDLALSPLIRARLLR